MFRNTHHLYKLPNLRKVFNLHLVLPLSTIPLGQDSHSEAPEDSVYVPEGHSGQDWSLVPVLELLPGHYMV